MLTIQDARGFVRFVQQRCTEKGDDNAYDAYLDILNAYGKGDVTLDRVKMTMTKLFWNDYAILKRFNVFLHESNKLDINW